MVVHIVLFKNKIFILDEMTALVCMHVSHGPEGPGLWTCSIIVFIGLFHFCQQLPAVFPFSKKSESLIEFLRCISVLFGSF